MPIRLPELRPDRELVGREGDDDVERRRRQQLVSRAAETLHGGAVRVDRLTVNVDDVDRVRDAVEQQPPPAGVPSGGDAARNQAKHTNARAVCASEIPCPCSDEESNAGQGVASAPLGSPVAAKPVQ